MGGGCSRNLPICTIVVGVKRDESHETSISDDACPKALSNPDGAHLLAADLLARNGLPVQSPLVP